MPRHRRTGDHLVVCRGLQPRVLRRLAILGQLDKIRVPQGRGFQPEHGLRRLGVAERLLHVSDDVRHHHPGADHWRHRGAHEVLRHPPLRDALDGGCLLSIGALGLGHQGRDERRLECRRENQGQRLRRRHGGAHVLRLVRARPLHPAGQAPGLRQGTHAAAQHGPFYGRHRHALGRLVWIQRRQRRRSRRCRG